MVFWSLSTAVILLLVVQPTEGELLSNLFPFLPPEIVTEGLSLKSGGTFTGDI